MELASNLRIIRKHFLLVLLTTFMAMGGALVVERLHHSRTSYIATVKLTLNPNVINRGILNSQGPGATFGSTGSGNGSGPSTVQVDLQTLVNTYDVYLLGNIEFAKQIVRDYHLSETPNQLLASLSTQLLPGTLFYAISASGYDRNEVVAAADAVGQGFVQADQQAGAAQAKQLQQGALSLSTGADPLVTVATTRFWNDRIAYLGKQLLSTLNDKTLTPDQLFQKVVSLQGSIGDAQTSLSKIQAPLQQQAQAALNSAATFSEGAVASPVSRSTLVKNLILFAALGGFIVGLALALLREYLDASLRTAEEASQVLSLPVLATVRHFQGRRLGGLARVPVLGEILARYAAGHSSLRGGQNADLALVTLTRPFDPGSEGFRNLRTGIQFSDAIRKIRTLVVISPLPNEGKSTVVANLAIVMAQTGQRVILVDADMRRPTQHTLFGLSGAKGLSSLYLEDDTSDVPATVSAALQSTAVPNLRLLAAGHVAPNPAELLASPRTPELIAALREQADLIIFDTPAMDLLTDGVILASQADGTVIVTRAHSTRRDVVLHALTRLTAVNARLLGVVFNMAQESGGQRYNRYYQRRRGAREPQVGSAVSSQSSRSAAMPSSGEGSPATETASRSVQTGTTRRGE